MDFVNIHEYKIPYLPDNVHKKISEFLQPTIYKCYIRLQQNGGCPNGIHEYIIEKECENCKNIYNNPKTFIYLKKGGNKKLFNKYIKIIKAKIKYNYFQLKGNYSHWSRMREISQNRNLVMKDLF